MDTRRLTVPAILIAASFTYGCTEVDSADLKTHGMYAKFTAIDSGTSVAVEAKLSTGPLSTDTISLSSGDNVYATFAGETRRLSENHAILGEYAYKSTFYTGGAEQQITIDFQRQNEVSAPNSYVVLPPDFTITGPTAGTAYSLSNNSTINVTWTPASSYRMGIEFSGACQTSSGSAMSFNHYYSLSSDSGSYAISTDALLQSMVEGKDPPITITSCGNISIEVTRSRSGTVDRNFGKGGYFYGKERRSTYVVLNP